jgi:hypothetical protein
VYAHLQVASGQSARGAGQIHRREIGCWSVGEIARQHGRARVHRRPVEGPAARRVARRHQQREAGG